MQKKITVLGAGSWGTALAMQLAKNNNVVNLWSHRREQAEILQTSRQNQRYLPDIFFPENLTVTADLDVALLDNNLLLLVVPSMAFRETLDLIYPKIFNKKIPIIWAIKGFEQGTGRLLSEVFQEKFTENYPHAMLAGPSFAKEVAQGKTTAVCIASKYAPEQFAAPFHGGNFICYTSRDLIGAQIGAAVKNVIAIAVGISDGLGGGANTRAALITRGLHEISRLAVALGANWQTLGGLAGMGDLLLTATDNLSRNRRFGLALGQGKDVLTARSEINQVIEGEGAAHDAWELACRHQIRMPITEHIHRLLNNEITVLEAVKSLSDRMLKEEYL